MWVNTCTYQNQAKIKEIFVNHSGLHLIRTIWDLSSSDYTNILYQGHPFSNMKVTNRGGLL